MSTNGGVISSGDGGVEAANKAPANPTWRNMPHKDQLTILALSRFVDFFQQAAIQTYIYYQLGSFNPDYDEAALSHETGILLSAFTFAQIASSFLWGLAADHPSVGRKLVLQIGLVGTAIGCVGVAFSRTFYQAVFWRLLSGAVNATVGSARSMLGERIPKPWHSRAFLLFPAAFNVANIAGPLLSGMLVGPVRLHRRSVGDGKTLMDAYPFAAPNLLCAFLLLSEALLIHMYLKETLKGKRPFDMTLLYPTTWLRTVRRYTAAVRGRADTHQLHNLQREPFLTQGTTREDTHLEKEAPRLPLRRIWTSNVLWTLLSIAIFDFHLGAFHNLWVLMLSTARDYVPNDDTTPSPPSFYKFASGLAFTPARVGQALSIIGVLGVALQFLLYPPANRRFGLMRCFRTSLFLFPVAYYMAPFIAQLPSATAPPAPASGWIVWFGITTVLFLHVTARTFAMPAVIILLNNSSPHPSVLGTINGLGQGCSATFRTLGPYASSLWFNTWRARGVVGVSWWIVASVAAAGCVASFWVRDGSGQQIVLPGEEAEVKEVVAGGGSADGR